MMQLEPHLMKVKMGGRGGNNERSVIDLKGAFKLIMLLPRAGIFRARMAEVPTSHFSFLLFLTVDAKTTGPPAPGWW